MVTLPVSYWWRRMIRHQFQRWERLACQDFIKHVLCCILYLIKAWLSLIVRLHGEARRRSKEFTIWHSASEDDAGVPMACHEWLFVAMNRESSKSWSAEVLLYTTSAQGVGFHSFTFTIIDEETWNFSRFRPLRFLMDLIHLLTHHYENPLQSLRIPRIFWRWIWPKMDYCGLLLTTKSSELCNVVDARNLLRNPMRMEILQHLR